MYNVNAVCIVYRVRRVQRCATRRSARETSALVSRRPDCSGSGTMRPPESRGKRWPSSRPNRRGVRRRVCPADGRRTRARASCLAPILLAAAGCAPSPGPRGLGRFRFDEIIIIVASPRYYDETPPRQYYYRTRSFVVGGFFFFKTPKLMSFLRTISSRHSQINRFLFSR